MCVKTEPCVKENTSPEHTPFDTAVTAIEPCVEDNSVLDVPHGAARSRADVDAQVWSHAP